MLVGVCSARNASAVCTPLGRFRTVLPVAVPHCAGVEFGMSFTCGGAFVELVPAIIRFIRKKTPTSGNYVTFVRPTTIS